MWKGITPGRGRPHFACCISNDDADAAAGVEGSVGVSRGRKGEREGGGEGPRTVDNDKVGVKNVLRLWMLDVSASLHVARRD